jgi:alpha-tubulin suppressor-like RCC1 family protein
MLRAPGRILLARSCVLVGRNLTCTLSPLKSPASHHDGRRALWVWGNGDFGKHGTGGEADAGVFAHEILEPEPLEGVGLKPDLLQEVAAGGAHTLLVTVTGRLLSCGLGETGQVLLSRFRSATSA